MANPVVTIIMENGDVMKAELYPEVAPRNICYFCNEIKIRLLLSYLVDRRD